MTATYPTDTTLIPMFKALIGCPKCKSRNVRTFLNVFFMDDDFPEVSTNFIHLQGQCEDCQTLLVVSPRLYMIDSTVCEPQNEEDSAAGTKIFEYGAMHFSGTLCDVGGPVSPERFECEWCDREFTTKRGLSIHKRKCPEHPDKVREREEAEEREMEKKAATKTKVRKRVVQTAPPIAQSARADKEQEWYECDYCGEEFAYNGARMKHQKTCGKRPDEPEERKALFLPSSTEVTQDPADVDKSILYTYGSDTLVSLVQEVQTSAYRKDFSTCPRTDYVDDGKGGTKSVVCGYEAEEDEWLSPPMLKEISFGISDLDILSSMTTPQEEQVVCISECPKCGRLSLIHQFITTMLWKDFVDHRRIMDEIIKRGLMEGKVKMKEMTEEQVDTRLDLEGQRLGLPEGTMKGFRERARKAWEKEIPEFELKCHQPKCQVTWTEKNSNPRWMTVGYLVARCPACGSQRPIQDEVVGE